MPLDIIQTWKQVTPELKAELLDMWQRNDTLRDPALAATRADASTNAVGCTPGAGGRDGWRIAATRA